MSNIYFTPYGVGLGHASRLMMVAERFQNSNINIRFSSFGEAAAFISRSGYRCVGVPPVEFSWSSEGGFSFKNTIANIPIWFRNFTKQVFKEVELMSRFSPNLVLSDSRLSPIVSARLLGIPSVVLLNQIKLTLSPKLHKFKIGRLFENINGEFIGTLWSLSDEILIPDLPPPYTISENNTWCITSVMKKIKYIGFITPKLDVSEENVNKVINTLNFTRSKPIVFFHISGPARTRMTAIKKIIDSQKSFTDIQYVISEGRPNGRTDPTRISDNGWYYEWCPIRDELFSLSEIVVLRGGHTAISQAIQFGKPIISIPIENHPEQLSNSMKISKIGLGISIENNKLTSKSIIDSINEILSNGKYKKKSNELMKLCYKLNGVENVVDIVRSYVR